MRTQKTGLSEGGRIWPLAAVAASAFVLWGLYCAVLFVGVETDAVVYLEPARNFARGWGLVTRLLEVAQVAAYPAGFKLPALYLHHGPLAPLLIGLGYRIFGLADWVPFAFSFAFFIETLRANMRGAGALRAPIWRPAREA
jgi:hypothetical protein